MDPDMVRQQEEAEAAARLQAVQQPQIVPPLAHPEKLEPEGGPLILERAPLPEPARATRAELEYMAQSQAAEAAAAVPAPAARQEIASAATTPASTTSLPEKAASSPLAPPPGATPATRVSPPQKTVAPPSAEPVAVVPQLATPLEPAAQQPLAPMPLAQQQVAAVQSAAAIVAAPSSPAPSMPNIGGWNAAFYCSVLAGAGIAGGIFAGTKLQLATLQGVAVGAAAGFLLGWLGAAGRLWSQGISAGYAIRSPFAATLFVLLAELCTYSVANTAPSAELSLGLSAAGGIVAYILALIGIRAGVRQR